MREEDLVALSKTLTLEILKSIAEDGICILVQTGDDQFSFDEGFLASKIGISDMAEYLVSKRCKDATVEKVLTKFERRNHDQKEKSKSKDS